MKNHKGKILTAIFVVVVLALAYMYGGSFPVLEEQVIEETATEVISSEKAQPKEASLNDVTPKNVEGDDKNKPVGEQPLKPAEPSGKETADKPLTCTLSVRCDTILNNIQWLDEEKVEIVPKDGIIYAENTVEFYDGESVFDLLLREMKNSKIHLEFENTPVYNSAYIEGIGNLYEFDCGELSGWMYRVNGWFPNYGCSRYQLKDGDRVEWVYTCDLGVDIGGGYSAKNSGV